MTAPSATSDATALLDESGEFRTTSDSLANGLAETARRIGIRYSDSLPVEDVSAEFVSRVPIGFARQHDVIGLATDDGTLTVALGSVESWPTLDVVRRFLKRPVSPVLAPAAQIQAAINAAYQSQTGHTQKLLDAIRSDSVLEELQRLPPREDLLETSDRAPVVKLVNLILFEAVTGLASDVHIQPYEDRLVVRLRIDGVLFDSFDVPKHLQDEVLSRIKVIGGMNIAEKRLPQDGRATVEVGDRIIDLRIASLPTSHGERIVIRLLDKSARLYTLEELGFGSETLRRFRRLIHLEHGIILVTGPTGSGKSTTLYAALSDINTREKNVVTLEDPIEYQLPGVSQTQINTKKGMTFASGLRSVLRQDPDIIMVGEIRDHETAVMAIQSSLTGHLVFSTLHTNDAASAVTRLLDLGIEPYLVASSLVGVLAQRLVRRNCPECTTADHPNAEELRLFGLESEAEARFQRGRGCEACRETGFRGRLAVSELLTMSDAIRSLVQQRANAAEILETCQRDGMLPMRIDGAQRAAEGVTTLSEVARVTIHATI